MLRRIDDFKKLWAGERKGTLALLRTLTDASLATPITPGRRTLGRVAWHFTLTIPEMAGHTGLKVDGPGEHEPVPATAAAIVAAYERASVSLVEQIEAHWTDETLLVEDDLYGFRWTRGFTLLALVMHESHHRGQMTVLMRQAGLPIAGPCGPSEEEWAAFGAPAPTI